MLDDYTFFTGPGGSSCHSGNVRCAYLKSFGHNRKCCARRGCLAREEKKGKHYSLRPDVCLQRFLFFFLWALHSQIRVCTRLIWPYTAYQDNFFSGVVTTFPVWKSMGDSMEQLKAEPAENADPLEQLQAYFDTVAL